LAVTILGGRRKAACGVSIPCLVRQENGLAVLSGAVFLWKMLLLTVGCLGVRLGTAGVGVIGVFPPAAPQLPLFLAAVLLTPIHGVLSVCSEVVSVPYRSPFGGGSLTAGKAPTAWTLHTCQALSQGSWLPVCFLR